MGVPTPRDPVSQGRDTLERITLLERRLATAIPKPTPTSGLAADIPASPSYWQFYFETDTGNMMVGNRTGGWRRHSGREADSARAWDTSAGTGVTALAGRSVTFVLPTILEPSETLSVTMDPVISVSGFDFIGSTSLIRNPTNTLVTVRLMQIMSVATQSLGVVWQIVPT